MWYISTIERVFYSEMQEGNGSRLVKSLELLLSCNLVEL
jgi:hypothetical protein